MPKPEIFEMIHYGVFTFHVAWMLLIVFGTATAFWARWWRPFQVGIVGGTLLSWLLFFGACPLTLLEGYLLKLASKDTGVLNHGFIGYYFSRWFGSEPPTMAITVGITLIGTVSAVLAASWWVERRLKMRRVRIVE